MGLEGSPAAVQALSATEVGHVEQADSSRGALRTVGFDRVLGPGAKQAGVFRLVAPVARAVLDGQCACVMAYGITGSGKTHTMQGPDDGSDPGVTPRLLHRIFGLIGRAEAAMGTAAGPGAAATGPLASPPQAQGGSEGAARPGSATRSARRWTVTISMLEIYNDQLRDLLHPSGAQWLDATRAGQQADGDWRAEAERALGGVPAPPRLELRTSASASGRVEVVGLVRVDVGSAAEAAAVLARGQAARATAATAVHNFSSRSHMVTIVDVEGPDCATEACGVIRGRLFLVDLAGAERVAASGAVHGGALMREARAINRSLASLADVLDALAAASSSKPQHGQALASSPRHRHIPYRNSKLTSLLQDALCPSGRAVLLVTLSPSAAHASESLRCLRFARRARRIRLGPARRAVAVLSKDADRHRLELALSRSEARRSALERELAEARVQLGATRDRSSGSLAVARQSADTSRRVLAAELALARRTASAAREVVAAAPDRTREVVRAAVDQARRSGERAVAPALPRVAAVADDHA
ncbi:hypothetical protein FNF27_00796 [Cafeteria roenbergensis]|uniref:Kinesin-like protein n=1 Tax=Cafeteria roenbergensis TaxID=33653 RepID=A0A5A8EIB7_CAFRO|nr:hypothetical protein FNF27_00796 [Cafeteria roenbergensis]